MRDDALSQDVNTCRSATFSSSSSSPECRALERILVTGVDHLPTAITDRRHVCRRPTAVAIRSASAARFLQCVTTEIYNDADRLPTNIVIDCRTYVGDRRWSPYGRRNRRVSAVMQHRKKNSQRSPTDCHTSLQHCGKVPFLFVVVISLFTNAINKKSAIICNFSLTKRLPGLLPSAAP